MSQAEPTPPARGPIAWMTRNSVAANLLMAVLLLGGLFGMMRVKQEVFPEFELDVVTVSVPYPGASPEEVEQGIVLALEEAVLGVDGIKRITSSASEGVGTVSALLLLSADRQTVLADVKNAVDRIRTFPLEAEDPSVAMLALPSQVVSLVISGDTELSVLHDIAEKARRELIAGGNVTQVELDGVPPLEIGIEIPREELEALGLSMQDVARQVTAASLELPAGAIETRSGEILVRVSDRRRAGEEFKNIVVTGTIGGARVRLGDIATISDGYAADDRETLYRAFDAESGAARSLPAVRVTVYRVGAETPSSVATAVKEYRDELAKTLPGNVQLAIWSDDSILLEERIGLLVNNGWLGLLLVFVVLALFLDLRLAFWVGLGIPISFLGAFAVMPVTGVSVNMVSLFGFIVTLGMVVDDAIVVGENAYEKMEGGLPPMQAAVEGAREMAVPISFAILTTAAAFAPLFFIPGFMGKIFSIMPAIVCMVLFFSLVESFFVLPAHLAHGGTGFLSRILAKWSPVNRTVSAGLQWFIRVIYEPVLRGFLAFRYAAVAAGVAVLMMAVGLVASGLVPFNFFPVLEGDVVKASARLPFGVPVEQSKGVERAIEDALSRALERSGEAGIAKGVFAKVGEASRERFGLIESGSHLVSVELQLVPSGEREISAQELAALWNAEMPELAGIDSLKITAQAGPGAGAAVDVQLSHPDLPTLQRIASRLEDELRTFPQLTNIDNTFASGKPQVDYELLPAARDLGLTASDVASQLRANFYGAEALREQRGRNEMKVMVRLPEGQRSSEYDLQQLRIRTPRGAMVPLEDVVDIKRGKAPTSIKREAGLRIVNVKADLAAGVESPREVLAEVTDSILPALEDAYPAMSWSFTGAQREQAEAFENIGPNYLLALIAIYGLLAVPFRSYLQPLVIMSAIPFGLVGAIVGHLVMGYTLSFVSVFGIIALSGVVVNDSLVLIDAANKRRAEGASPTEAIIWAGQRRMRPILLTSLTTFFGLMPMIFETSVQARFLIPMAISLGFGVLFATVIVLLLVPSLYLIIEDFRPGRRMRVPKPKPNTEDVPRVAAK